MPTIPTPTVLIAIALALSASAPSWSQGAGVKAAIAALESSPIPSEAKDSIRAKIEADEGVFGKLLAASLVDRSADPMLLRLVDKDKPLPGGYEPPDLILLDGKGLSVSRTGHRLRAAAFEALKAMSAAARAEGITLLVSSAYRSYSYQVQVWNRTVGSDGLAEAEASVAIPGHSQHQMGTAVDFGSITDAFAETKAGRWLAANAGRFGYSLSFPKGMSAATGYKWESWHYRYIGKAAAELQGRYFLGMQQYLLLFLDELQ